MKKFFLVLSSLFVLCGCVARDWKPGTQVEHRLVAVGEPTFVLDIRYATTANFTHQKLYPIAGAWLNADAFHALERASRIFAKQGLKLKIYDGYRPLSVQKLMWDLIRDDRYVANPAVNRGRHTRGTAVDVTLVDAHGKELDMPSAYDDFTEKAHRNFAGATPLQAKNSKMLEKTMVECGFIPYPYEWWHFDLKGWEKYPVLDITFEELKAGQKSTKSIE